MCRVAIPDYDTWFTERVTSVKYSEFLGQPEVISVSLANALPKLSNAASRMQSSASASAESAREAERELRSTSNTSQLNLIRTEEHDEIFRQAGLVIDPSGVLIFAKDGKFDTKFSQIDVRADGLDLRCGNLETGLQSEIRIREDSITAVSNRIDLIAETYVTINRLQTDLANLQSAYASSITTENLAAGTCSFTRVTTGALSVGNGGSAYWCTLSYNGSSKGQFLGNGNISLP